MSDQPPKQIPGDTPLSVTLSLAQWQQVLQFLFTGPFSLQAAGPIYGAIDRQCGAQLRNIARPNGEAPHEAIGHA